MNKKEKFIGQARAWLGSYESNGSFKTIIDTYNSYLPHPRGYKMSYADAWCAAFVSACAIKTDCTDIVPVECGCYEMINLFKNLNEWVENDAYYPSAGDIIFYDWQDSGSGDNIGHPDHCGIVVKVDEDLIYVIEGNKSDSVAQRVMTVNSRYIRGYGVPAWKTAEDPYKAALEEIKTILDKTL